MNWRWILLFIAAATTVNAELGNVTQCQLDCVEPILEELTFVSGGNLTAFLYGLGTFCKSSTVHKCLAACGTLPTFATAKICRENVHKNLPKVEHCLEKNGAEVENVCTGVCGSFEDVNRQWDNLTSLVSDASQHKAHKLTKKTKEACRTVKCNVRCAAHEFGDRCEHIDGKPASLTIKPLVEGAFQAALHDLASLNLTGYISDSVPHQCNYLYIPDVLFESSKDALTHFVVHKSRPHFHLGQEHQSIDKIIALDHLKHKLLLKEMEVLDIEHRVIKKRAKKIKIETQVVNYLTSHNITVVDL